MNSIVLNLIEKPVPGKVALVGAGPGDPDLITVKGLQLLRGADAVVYDRLANPQLLEHCPATCSRHYVGKRKDQHSMPQEKICDLLADLARQGKRVVRLKGGDPFVFGRGGEELDYLKARGIACEVIPGISAAIGCAAQTHIPLTHRDHADALILITGHRKDDRLDINWELALAEHSTVVFYMGLSRLPQICSELLLRGCPPTRPFAVIANGTCADQQVLTGTVSDISDKLREYPMPSPALLVMGDVVAASDCADLLLGAQQPEALAQPVSA